MRTIPLTKGYEAIVDDGDYDTLVAMGSWYADRAPHRHAIYARRNPRVNGRVTIVRMHAVIMGVARVDHANGNGLDNRRANLRPASPGQNLANIGLRANNTSGYKGVYRRSWDGPPRWLAEIRFGGRRFHLGSFDDPVSAAHAYDAEARALYGEFARPNFPVDVAARDDGSFDGWVDCD